jgi:hypothetical protein
VHLDYVFCNLDGTAGRIGARVSFAAGREEEVRAVPQRRWALLKTGLGALEERKS